jgi:general secretion pathway protein J
VSSAPRNRGSHGFTLIELLLGLALLALMMAMVYAALNFALRSWDTGDARITESAHLRVVDTFLRRGIKNRV